MSPWLRRGQQAWQSLAPRERQVVRAAVVVLAAVLLWTVGVAPAWRTVQQAPQRRAQLEPQLQEMRALAAEARALQAGGEAPAARRRDETLAELQRTTQRTLGSSAQWQPAPQGVVVTLKGAEPQALAQWLQDVRLNTGLLTTQAHLERMGGGGALWNGTLTLSGAALESP